MARTAGTVFISGGGSGIGLQLSRIALARGADLAVFDLAIGEEVRDELSALAGNTNSRPLGADAGNASGLKISLHDGVDVRDLDALSTEVNNAVGAIGPPTLAINSAGISTNQLFVESTLADFERTVAVNLFGSRNFAFALAPHMRPGSRLALIASLAGLTGGYTYSAYASSKAGVVGLGRVLRLEWAQDDIGVSVICPPEIMTPMVEQYNDTMHPATRALKDVAGTLAIDEACEEIMDLLDKGRFMVIPGRKARRAATLTRYLPDAISTRMADRIVRRAIARAEGAKT